MDARVKTDEGWMPEFRFFEGGSEGLWEPKRPKPVAVNRQPTCKAAAKR